MCGKINRKPRIADQNIIACPARQIVRTRSTKDQIAASAADDRIGSDAAINRNSAA